MTSRKQPTGSPALHGSEFDDTHTLNGDSGSDAGESLMGHHHRREKNWDEDEDEIDLRTKKQQCPWRRRCCSPWVQGIMNVVLALAVVGLLFERQTPTSSASTNIVSTTTTTTTTVMNGLEGSGDITGFIPPVGQEIKTFVPNMSFVPEDGNQFFKPEVKKMWLSLVPPGLGYLDVKEPEKYHDLPHPLKGYGNKDKTVFTTSVTHQLHCLYNIVEVYSGLQSGHPVPPQMTGHLPHCFEYLRQSIMCCGDTAIEGQHTTFPDGIVGSDGWDAKHVCKDYGAIYDYLKENSADDLEWI